MGLIYGHLQAGFRQLVLGSRGKLRHQFRRKGHPRVTIKGRPGSPEFMEHDHALLAKTGGTVSLEIGASRRKAGTVNALAVAQRNNLKAIRFLIRFAISEGELAHDPTADIELLKADGPKSIGHMRWLEPQITQYRERHALGTVARLALELLLNIAARRHDAHLIGQQHEPERKADLAPTQDAADNRQSALDRNHPQPTGGPRWHAKQGDGRKSADLPGERPWKAIRIRCRLRQQVRRFVRRCGLKPVVCDDGRTRHYRAHGLRKSALRALAYASCTGVELMAVSGHSTLSQVQVYIDEVDQERGADAAITKLVGAPEIKTATASD